MRDKRFCEQICSGSGEDKQNPGILTPEALSMMIWIDLSSYFSQSKTELINIDA